MPSLKERLVSVETDFLAALTEGEDSMSQFETRLTAIMDDVDRALASNSLDSETATLAHMVSWRCATLADTTIELFSNCDSLTSQLMTQIDSLMSELTIEDSPRTPPLRLLSPSSLSPLPRLKRTRRGPEEDSSAQRSKKRKVSEDSHHPSTPKLFKRTCAATPVGSGGYAHRAIPPSPSLPNSTHLKYPTPPPLVLPAAGSSRKRRRSDADAHPLPSKRLHVGPRLHAVSDSFSARTVGDIPSNLVEQKISRNRDQFVLPHPSAPLEIQPFTAPVDSASRSDDLGFLDHIFDISGYSAGWSGLALSPTPSPRPSSSGTLSAHTLEPLLDPSLLSVSFHLDAEQADSFELMPTLQYSSSSSSSPSVSGSLSPSSTSSSTPPSTPTTSPNSKHVALAQSPRLSASPNAIDELLSMLDGMKDLEEKASETGHDAPSPVAFEEGQDDLAWSSIFDILEPGIVPHSNPLDLPGILDGLPSGLSIKEPCFMFPGELDVCGFSSLGLANMGTWDSCPPTGLGLFTTL